MRQAIVSVDADGLTGLGIEEVTACFRNAGLQDIEILSCDWRGGVCRVRVDEEIDANRLDDFDVIEWWEQVACTDSHAVYLLEIAGPDQLALPDETGGELLPAGMVEVNDDGFKFDISGSQSAIGSVLDAYEDVDVDVTLEGLRDYPETGRSLDALTDRQQEVIETAFDHGYYDVPRTASTDDLATHLGLDSSTVSEHLQRAERNLLATVLDGRH